VIGLLLVFVMAGLAAAFMQASVRGSAESLVSGNQTRVLYVAEAGVNDAIVDLRAGGSGNIGAKASLVPFGGGGYWVEAIDHGDYTFTVKGTGVLGGQRRAVEVVLAPELERIFTRALFGELDLGASGTVFTDSYESDMGTYASQAVNVHGPTGLTYAKAGGHLGSNADINLSGTVTVLGNATPGVGHSVNIGGTGIYIEGSTAPAATPEVFPTLDYLPEIPSAGDYSETTDHTISTGEYRYSTFLAEGKATITISGDVTLWVDASFRVGGQAEIVISPGSSLTIHHGSGDMVVEGGGVVNTTKMPRNFKVLSSGDLVKLSGSSEIHGAVFAPNAVVDPGGTSDIYGSFVGRQIVIDGTANFHFDEALMRNPELRQKLRVVSWRRVSAED
jgi:hypothetical protein